MNDKHYFSSESVTEGHPDKVCDQISDAVLDAILAQDPNAHVACETACTTGMVMVMGEITTSATIDIPSIARGVVKDIGYHGEEGNFDYATCAVMTAIDEQSPDIAQGVDAREADGKDGAEQGAGDQGIMFGYASNETPELMPAPIMFSHRIMMELAKVRHSGAVTWLRPDSKSQVAVEYGENGRPVRILNVVLSTQHTEEVDIATIREFCTNLIRRCLPAELITPETEFFINPTGRFVVGGPHGDSGLTGRKIIVDTYGGMGRHGGGAFSGKDCSKVDRSGAYMCRWVAKHVVAAGLADRCELQVGYAIGKASPVSIMIDVETFGTAKVDKQVIIDRINEAFSFKPADMERVLGLREPIFRKTTNYGHFTKADLPWEQLDPRCLSILMG